MEPTATNMSEQGSRLSSVVHRIAGVSMHPFLFQHHGSKQGQLQQVVQVHVQLGFKYLLGQRLHKLSAPPVLVFNHP